MTTSSRERPTQKTAGPDGAPPQRRRLNLSIQERLRRLRLDRDPRRPTATKYVYGKSRRAVHEKWLVMTAASRRGPVAPTHPRLSEYLERWLNESVRPNLAPQTVANYEFFSRAYIDPDLGSKRIDRLTVRDVRLWMNDLRVRCQCCAQRKDSRRRMDQAPGMDGAAERADRRRTGRARLA